VAKSEPRDKLYDTYVRVVSAATRENKHEGIHKQATYYEPRDGLIGYYTTINPQL
jgi:hypothetical protein